MNLPPKIVKGSSDMDKAFLPYEIIIINILSWLPIKAVVRCKCVCKSWLELLETLLKTPEFAKDHLSKSVPGLIVYHDVFKIFEFVDELELEHHNLNYNLIMEFKKVGLNSTPPNHDMGIVGSANGLILLWGNYHRKAVYVCNPITREYIELPCLDPYEKFDLASITYGFGVSLMSGQYKVVSIVQAHAFDTETNEILRISRSECWVYTLGTGEWKNNASCPFYDYNTRVTHAFLNGNLHWLVEDKNAYFSDLISCYNLDTEVFSTLSPPPPLGRPSYRSDPIVFEDCLCICENTLGPDNKIVMWVLKEYENESSWTKQFVFTKDPNDLVSHELRQSIYPLKLFEDGDILLQWGAKFLFYYSKKTKTSQKLDLFKLNENRFLEARLHVSCFLSLTSFAMEIVRKF